MAQALSVQSAILTKTPFVPAARPDSLSSRSLHRAIKIRSNRLQHGRSSTVVQAAFRKSTTKTKEAYICLDCGYIYAEAEPFQSLPSSYRCPVCRAPKRRFKVYEQLVGRNPNDLSTRKARKAKIQGGQPQDATIDEGDKSLFLYGGIGGALLLAALYFALNSLY